MKKYWKEFENFLRREGVYKKYMNNLDNEGRARMNLTKPYSFVNDAFLWVNTREGCIFWKNINDKWQIEVEQNEMKTAEEIAQWVIDNRYQNSDFDKISDDEMYNILVDSINKLCYAAMNVIG